MFLALDRYPSVVELYLSHLMKTHPGFSEFGDGSAGLGTHSPLATVYVT